MPLKKPKEPKPVKEKKAKAPKEKKPKKVKPPKEKKVKKGKNAPEEVEGTEEEQQPKKKLPLILFIIPPVVIAAAAFIIFFKVLPMMKGEADEDADPEVTVTVEPEPPVLPTEIPIGDDVSITGLALEADESEAQAVKAKTVTYTYINLVDAGKAAQTYAGQLAGESPAFTVVDEEFVRQQDKPDYTTDEGMVLLARNAPVVASEEADTSETESEAEEIPEFVQGVLLGGSNGFDAGLLEPLPVPEPEEPITYVHTVRITWSPGQCVVTVDEQEGKVTSPASSTSSGQSLTIRGAVGRLQEMDPAKLGLGGDSMGEYELIAMDATEMVDGVACINIYVYNSSDYQFAGSYLLSIDGEHLYSFDPINKETVELKDYP